MKEKKSNREIFYSLLIEMTRVFQLLINLKGIGVSDIFKIFLDKKYEK